MQIFFSEGPENTDSCHTFLFQPPQQSLCDQKLSKKWTTFQEVWGAFFFFFTTNLFYHYHTFGPEFLFCVLLLLAVVSISGDRLSEVTHAKGSEDLSVRV